MGNSTKELINAFNLNNYACDKISTNFTVEGKKIVGLFASGTNIGEYLQRMEEKIIKRHYGTREITGKYYHLNCFPFVLGANPNKEYLDNGIVKVKLANSTNDEVIRNLKVHFASEFERVVGGKVIARLQKAGITEDGAYEWIKGTVKTGAIGKPYLYCIAFSDEYLKGKCDSETFEILKGMYIQEFNSRLEACGLKSSDFYKYEDDMLYIKDVSDKVVKSITEYVKKEVVLHLGTPGIEDSKVKNFKDVLSSLMSKQVRKFINTYDYDIFTDEKKIQKGDSFVLIPLIKMDDGKFCTLNCRDASRINGVFNSFISDIKGKTAKLQYANAKGSVYAFSNQQIALLLPKIMESPIAYNEISGNFEFAVDLENFERRSSSRFSSTATSPTHTNSAGSSQPQSPSNSPTHAGLSGLKTPPNQRKRNSDSGYDSNSPPKPKDSGSSSGGPGPSTEPSDMECKSSGSISGLPNGHLDGAQLVQLRSPTGKSQDGVLKESSRQGFEELFMSHKGTSEKFPPRTYISFATVVSEPSSSLQSVGAAQNVRAGTSAWSQPIGFWSSPTPSAEPSLWQPSRPLSRKGANESGSAWTSQPIGYWSSPAPSAGLWSLPQSGPSSWKGASERRTSDKLLTEEEEKLSKALLYWFNLNNYALDPPHTNFIV
ncbi:hypothetical protein EUZ93_00830, partial [Wolbachia pipientis]|nr:hypothetical protein [Wolbachia pipientis]